MVEGNGGLLRAGLPWQSVHDGARPMHEPLRLAVVVEAPRDAIEGILARHPEVAALFDNGWLHLLTLADGALVRREAGGRWTPLAAAPRAAPGAAALDPQPA